MRDRLPLRKYKINSDCISACVHYTRGGFLGFCPCNIYFTSGNSEKAKSANVCRL